MTMENNIGACEQYLTSKTDTFIRKKAQETIDKIDALYKKLEEFEAVLLQKKAEENKNWVKMTYIR